MATYLGKYRNAFIVLTIILIGFAHYSIYKKPNTSRVNKGIVWATTVIAAGTIIYSQFNGSG